MDGVKISDQSITEETSQAKVPDHLVKDYPICIFRHRDLLANQEQIIPVSEKTGIIESLKRRIRTFFF